MKLLKRYCTFFLFEWKRCFMRMGRLLAGLVLLGIVCFVTVYGFSRIEAGDEAAASRYTVVFVMPENAGLHYSLALGFISGMDSLSSLCTIQTTTSEEEARSMLSEGLASAVVIIPEGMIHSIRTGSNDLPARILYPGNPSLETIIFRQIVDSLSRMVASSQKGIYALYELYDEYGASDEQQDKANARMNDLYISTVLGREALFQEEAVIDSRTEAFGSADFLTGVIGGAVSLLFLLFGINLCAFLTEENASLAHALTHLRLTPGIRLAVDFIVTFLCEYVIFTVFLLIFRFIAIKAALLPAFPAWTVPAAAAFPALFSCSLQCLLCRICRSRQSCIIATFFVSLLLMYCSGSLIPAVFLPDFLRSLSAKLPGARLTDVTGGMLNGRIDIRSGLVLTLWCAVFLLASRLCTAFAHRGGRLRLPHNTAKKGYSS